MNYLDFYASSDTCQQMAKFCDFWGYERTLNTQVMQEEYGIPTLGIDRVYVVRLLFLRILSNLMNTQISSMMITGMLSVKRMAILLRSLINIVTMDC